MLPKAEYFNPGPDISWLVRQFESIIYNNPNEITDKFVPREDVSVVFQFGDLPRLVSPANQLLPHYFIAPVTPSANSIRISGNLNCFIATCNPTILSRVLDISLKPEGTIHVSLPDALLEPVWKEMKTEHTAAGRITIFTRFINRLHPARYVPDETDRIYDMILQKGINTQLHDIISECAVSERTLQRRFRTRLGATPKMLVRILRINYIWSIIHEGADIDYHDLVFLGHYFDQNHLIKDFKSITGETPERFFRRNLGVARILSGK